VSPHRQPRAACTKVQMSFALSQGRGGSPSGGCALTGDEFVFWKVLFHVSWSSAGCPGAQGAGVGISCCTLAFQPETPAWHHSALGQHQTLDALAGHQRVSSESLANESSHLSPTSDFLLANNSPSCTINIWEWHWLQQHVMSMALNLVTWK